MSEMHSDLPAEEGLTPPRAGRVFATDARFLARGISVLSLVIAAIYLAVFISCSVGTSILVPYSDMIDLIENYFRAVDLGGPLEYLFRPHNLHRLPWFRSLIALDMGLFRGTGLPLVASAAVSLIGTAFLLMNEMRKVAHSLSVPLMVVVGMLVFLTANAAGISVPANTPHLHTTFFSVLTLATAASANGSWRSWAAATAFAAAASFSLATALVLWPILVLMAWRAGESWKLTGSVGAASAVFCVAYMIGQPTTASMQQPFDPQGLAKAAEYFLAYMGLPWVRGSKQFGELLGAALLLASAFALMRLGFTKTSRLQQLSLGMILFSIGSGLLAAVGRRDITVEVDVPVRYAILLAPLHVGLLLHITPAILRMWGARSRTVACGVGVALALLMAQQVTVGLVVVRAADRARQTMLLYQQGERTPEMLQWIYPDLSRADAVYAEMKRRGIFLSWAGQLKTPASASRTTVSGHDQTSVQAGTAPSSHNKVSYQAEQAPK